MDTPFDALASAHVIAAHTYQTQRWQNGRGRTQQILRVPDVEQWQLRLSIAQIEEDAPFSTFAGVERELILLHGEGLRLCFADGRSQVLQPPHARVRFAGEAAVEAQLLDGPTTDFNVMWRRGALQVTTLHRPLVGNMVFFSEPHVAWAIYLLAGHAQFDGATGLPGLSAGDTAWLPAGERQRYRLEGGGELLAIRVEYPTTAADAQA